MITLALAQMMYFFALQAQFTGGEDGIQAVPRGKLFGIIDLDRPDDHVRHVVLVIFLAGFLLIYRIIHSPFGEVLKAIRENEPRAISLGYKTDRYKLVAFVLSATLAGLAGATKAIVFQLASLTDVDWPMSGEVVLMTLVGGLGTDVRAGGRAPSSSSRCRTISRQIGEWVLGHPGRDLRRLRAAVPPRHRRRARQQAAYPPLVSAAPLQPLRIVVHGDLTLYAVVFVQLSVVVDAFASFGCRLSRVPGGTQWRLRRAESASIRLPRNGTRSRSGGLPMSVSLSAAAAGSTSIPKNDLACICAKPSALRPSGPSSRRPGLPRHLAEIQCFRPLETRVTAAPSSAI